MGRVPGSRRPVSSPAEGKKKAARARKSKRASSGGTSSRPDEHKSVSSRSRAATVSKWQESVPATIRKIRYYGDPILKVPSRKVLTITPGLVSLVREMLETLAQADGLGLAAQQVGETVALTVLNLRDLEGVDESLLANGDTLVFLNPEMTEEEGRQTEEEGCLSFPGLYVRLTRPERVVITGQRLVGEKMIPVEIEARGLFARVLCHEIDHLAGRLIIDRLSPFARVRALTQWRMKLAEALRDSE